MYKYSKAPLNNLLPAGVKDQLFNFQHNFFGLDDVERALADDNPHVFDVFRTGNEPGIIFNLITLAGIFVVFMS